MKETTTLRLRFAVLGLLLLILAPAGRAVTVLHNFLSGNDGSTPFGSLTLSGSKFYGMTYSGGSGTRGTIFSMNTDGSGYSVLRNFTSTSANGRFPYGSLTLSGSKLYGMTSDGGSNADGTVFSVNTDGTAFTLLRSFTGGADGGQPFGSLTLSGSKLYGMTSTGIGNFGTLFSINTDGTGFSLLHAFALNATDGGRPNGSLTLSGSKLYGTTTAGGSGGYGTVFSINTDGTGYSLVHSFASIEGSSPHSSLTLSGSKLYGTTQYSGGSGYGTAFSVNTDGSSFSILHNFSSNNGDGSTPYGSLTLFGSTLFGMTNGGGSEQSVGLGTLFRINTDGSGFSLMHSFTGQPGDGARPEGDLTLSADGQTLYGMTTQGGTGNRGVIFSAPSGVPEPTSTALLALSGLTIAARRRRALS